MNVNKDTLTGNLACAVAYLIFGLNLVACKNIANCGMVSPMALFCMRAIGALVLFWSASAFLPKPERVERRDLWKIAAASFLGLFLTQISFLKAITMTTPVDASLISLMSPIATMIVAAIVIKDKITKYGVLGLAISFAGVLFIVLNSVSIRSGASETSVMGLVLMLVNVLSFASYVGIFKPLIKKYSVITFMKWMFIFATVYALPFGAKDLISVPYDRLPPGVILQILFVVVFATFIAYFLIPIGQKRIKPMIVCMYTYLQPVVAMAISFSIGLDVITWQKAVATLFIFAGVSICNFRNRSRAGLFHHPAGAKDIPDAGRVS